VRSFAENGLWIKGTKVSKKQLKEKEGGRFLGSGLDTKGGGETRRGTRKREILPSGHLPAVSGKKRPKLSRKVRTTTTAADEPEEGGKKKKDAK